MLLDISVELKDIVAFWLSIESVVYISIHKPSNTLISSMAMSP